MRASATLGRGAEVHRVSARVFLSAGAVALLLAISFSMATGVGVVVERLTGEVVAKAEVSTDGVSTGQDHWHYGKTGLVAPHVVDQSFDERRP